MISVICCYNNEEMYKDFVVNSLKYQNSEYELIGIDNRNGKFKSAAKAYNDALKKVSTDYCVFMHHDIAFEQIDFLSKLELYLSQHPETIVGFCGINNNSIVYSNLCYKSDGSFIVRNQLDKALEVESIDECCFAISTSLLKKLGGFNEEICNGWHLYAVELCLRVKIERGHCIVLPISIYHKWDNKGGLETDNNFLKTMRNISKRYKSLGIIYAPCYICSTNSVKRELRLIRSFLANYKKKKIFF